MAGDQDTTEYEMTMKAKLCAARIQELYSFFDLNAVEGPMVAAETLGWSLLVTTADREMVNRQAELMFEGVRKFIAANFEAHAARREVLMGLAGNVSGGRLQ